MTSVRVERPTRVMPDRPQPFALKPLDWDTEFFGARMGTVVATAEAAELGPEVLRSDLQRVLQRARADGYAHVIFRAAADETTSIWAAEGAGMRLVDVGIDSTFKFASSPIPEVSRILTVRPLADHDISTICELAAEAFTLSRFSADPFFSETQVKDFHRTWARNLCTGLAQAVLVAEIDGTVAGFVSCAGGRIPLIGVDGRFRGQGVGQALVSAALHWFRDAGCDVAHVKTQAHNYRALALYHRAGFIVSRSDLTFSATLSSAPNTPTEVDL